LVTPLTPLIHPPTKTEKHIETVIRPNTQIARQLTTSTDSCAEPVFRRCLAKSRGSTPEQRDHWREGVYDEIQEVMPLQGSLSIERMCQLAGVSRVGFYRSLQNRAPVEEDMEVRSVILEIAVEHRRRYGYRRITAELRRRGMLVNHKRVLRNIREDDLLAVQPRTFVVTTDSDHEFEVYVNLARRMKLTGMNQLWVADLTYIRLRRGFVYLAVVLDAFSRKVVGWTPDRTLARRLPITALEQAIAQRQPPPGLVHHSDCGVQYASGDYVKVLQDHKMIPSVNWPANPYDNASCESFLKTLNREEVYANDYRDLELLRGKLEAFIEQYYNRCRLHSALGHRPPEEFERDANTAMNSAGAIASFFRHGEIYQSDAGGYHSGEQPQSRPLADRPDESPAGYSSASCSPAKLASASPAERHPEGRRGGLERKNQ
jgi:putative transposase